MLCGFHIVNLLFGPSRTDGLISLVNDNYVDNNLKEIWCMNTLSKLSTQKLPDTLPLEPDALSLEIDQFKEFW